MNKTLFFCLILCLFSWTNTSAQIKPNPMWDKDFVDTCVVIPLGVDFGACAMALGWALSDSGCVMLSGCSMIGSNGTDYSTSFFPSSYQCNGACMQDTIVMLSCIDSTLIDLNVLCPGILNPFVDVIPLPIPMRAKPCFTEELFLIQQDHVPVREWTILGCRK
ncbi:MAG: hypothetical protein ORN53_08265 [Crocinitomicaceae bacterium]|nr:hypothetical protein [Crocinitomicaceae bacterium]